MNRYYRNVLSMLMAILILVVFIAIIFPKEKIVENVSIDDYIVFDMHKTNYEKYLKEQEIIKQKEIEHKKKIELSSRSMTENKRTIYSTDLKVKSNLSTEQLEKGLIGDSKKYAKDFVKAEEKYGINALILASISAQESGYMSSNMSNTKNNVFGFGSMKFSSKSECIDYVANFLNDEYLDKDGKFYHGTDLKDVNVHYCLTNDKTDYEWSKKIKEISKIIYKKALE